MTQIEPPSLADQVAVLAENLQILVEQSVRQNRVRVLTTVVLGAFIGLLAASMAYVFTTQTNNTQRITCIAVNQTNAALLQLLDVAMASTPVDPPEGSSPLEIKAFREQQARSIQFLGDTRELLAPKPC